MLQPIKDDFELIVKHLPQNDDIKIYPIADIHVAAKNSMRKKFTSFVDGLAKEPNAYIVLDGDLLNNATKDSISFGYDDDMTPSQEKIWISNQLEKVADRILMAVPGNHECRSSKSVDAHLIEDICTNIGIRDLYRENAAFLKLQIGDIKGQGSKNPTYTVGMVHGAGGGGTFGAAVNRNVNFAYGFDGLDVLITAHFHKSFGAKPAKLVIDKHNNKITQKPFACVGTSSWLLFGGYALKAMMRPSANDVQTIYCYGNRKQVEVRL